MADQITPTAESKAEPTTKDPAVKAAEEPTQSPSDSKPVEEPKVEEKTVPLTRFSEVNAKLKALQDEKEASEKKQLEEQGKWKELAEANEAKATAAESKFREAIIENSVIQEASKLGIVDSDAASKLLNRANVKVEEDGTVSGVDDALKALIVDKPYLVPKDATTRIGSGSNPANDGNQSPTETTFKRSQMQDTKFFRENEKEIMAALAAGRVIDDVTK